jgi:hypothetical protein
MGFDFSIEYKMGRENIVADALSRRDETVSKEEQKSAELVALSSPTPNWVEVIKEEVDNDKDLQELIQRVKDGEAENSSLISAILEQIHGGFHEGYHKTFQCIRANFYWKGMRSRIKTFIRECEVCQRHKVEVTTPKGLLHPLPIPVQIWEDLLMDFIDGLPSSRGKSTIFVIVDRLSKYAHFLAISHPYTAISVAQVFFDNIFKLHGMPSLLCAIETQLLQANSGRNSLIYRARVLISAQHITPKRMAKRKW